jgi:hypothetical protein
MWFYIMNYIAATFQRSALKKERVCFSETAVSTCVSTWPYNPEEQRRINKVENYVEPDGRTPVRHWSLPYTEDISDLMLGSAVNVLTVFPRILKQIFRYYLKVDHERFFLCQQQRVVLLLLVWSKQAFRLVCSMLQSVLTQTFSYYFMRFYRVMNWIFLNFLKSLVTWVMTRTTWLASKCIMCVRKRTNELVDLGIHRPDNITMIYRTLYHRRKLL